MKLIRQLSEFPDSLRGCAVTIGNFDGVHRGHAVLIDQLKSFASELNGAAVVFTFHLSIAEWCSRLRAPIALLTDGKNGTGQMGLIGRARW